jgi:hypothetical protein
VGTSRSWDAKDLAAARHTFLPGELDDRPDRSIATPLRQYPHWVSISFETSSSQPLDIVAPVSVCPAMTRASRMIAAAIPLGARRESPGLQGARRDIDPGIRDPPRDRADAEHDPASVLNASESTAQVAMP